MFSSALTILAIITLILILVGLSKALDAIKKDGEEKILEQ